MDKNEYNLRLEEIKKQISLGNYAEAAKLADEIDWRKVRNVNTLCMISEVYEAEKRYEDSRTILQRAYRRSPSARIVLCRLVECSIALKQFDEAIEYYTEYVRAAPHDNNKYILKYKIYRGRGSSLNEQIEILKEYLEQEYNEEYAYEEARLLQQADRMEECISVCDDLVLWFHSGKYVIKALELKKRYAPLTPAQQAIYDQRFDEDEEDQTEEEQLGTEKQIVDTRSSSLADTILEDTEKSIAQDIAIATGKITKKEESPAQESMKAQSVQKDTAAQENLEVFTAQENTEAQAAQKTKTAWENVEALAAQESVKAQAVQKETAVWESVEALVAEKMDTAQESIKAQAEQGLTDGKENIEAAAAEKMDTAQESIKAQAEQGLTDGKENIEAAAAEKMDTAQENVNAQAMQMQGTEEPGAGTADEGADASGIEDSVKTPQELQNNVVRDMRQIVGNVGRMDYVNENEEAADEIIEESKKDQEAVRGIRARLRMPSFRVPDLQKKQAAGQLTIDDILLSMGERGDAVRRAASQSQAAAQAAGKLGRNTGVLSAVDEALLNIGVTPAKALQEDEAVKQSADGAESDVSLEQQEEERRRTGAQLAEAFDVQPEITQQDLTEDQQQFTEKIREEENALKNVGEIQRDGVFPWEKATNASEDTADMADLTDGQTDSMEASRRAAAQEREDLLHAKTRVVPVEEISRAYRYSKFSVNLPTEELVEGSEPEKTAAQQNPVPEIVFQSENIGPSDRETDRDDLFFRISEQREQMDERELGPETEAVGQKALKQQEEQISQMQQNVQMPEPEAKAAAQETVSVQESKPVREESAASNPQTASQNLYMNPETEELFEGFLEVGSLRNQIVSAISVASSRGGDKTSRTGNILIFGAHGCGKTAIATGLAKAIAGELGKKYVKMARIYATDLNRKDIAAAIAKIAGGVLIIEEAGDLEDNVADQMTTAMEFRTDGLVVILEDEQKYLHDLLMRHPRLTMKFTSEIHIPVYTPDELVNFACICADEQDCALSDTAQESLAADLGNRMEHGEEVSITTVQERVEQAVARASRLSRRLFGGKKRYDENGRVILREKDFVS